MTNQKLPWSLHKIKGSTACYSDIVNADGHPICYVQDVHATAIVEAVNGESELRQRIGNLRGALKAIAAGNMTKPTMRELAKHAIEKDSV